MKGLFRMLPSALALLVILGLPRSSAASACLPDASACFYRAAAIDSWLDRFLAGIDCEMAFADCVANELCK